MDITTDTNIINSLDELSIFNFYKCVDGELQYLYKDYNGEKKVITIELYNQWRELYDEYSKKAGGNQSLQLYLLASELLNLENMFEIVPVIINQMTLNISQEHYDNYLQELNLWGIPVSKSDKLSKALKILLNKKNKYKRKLAEYKELTKDKEKPLTLYQETARLERILKISIDVRKINVLQWLAYFEEVKLITQKNSVTDGE